MCPYYLYRYQKVLKFAPMLEGLLLEVVCKEELKRTITHDFMYISVGLGFFWATLYIYTRRFYLFTLQAAYTHTHTHNHTHSHTHTHFPFIPIIYTPIHNPVGPMNPFRVVAAAHCYSWSKSIRLKDKLEMGAILSLEFFPRTPRMLINTLFNRQKRNLVRI